jgi:hypothetical protein
MVPIAAASWMIGTNAMTASASQDVGPTKAVQLLSTSRTVDAKCRYLSSDEHQELSDYLAKAEIVAAGRQGSAKAQGAVKAGAQRGAAMTCNNESEIVVRATMDAARRAIDHARNQAAVHKASVQQPAKVEKKKLRSDDRNKKTLRQSAKTLTGGLMSYSHQAAAYYVERRCRHLSQNQAMKFWRKIVAKHNALIDRHGPDAVRKAKNAAISKSRASGRCGSQTAKLVRRGYASIR